MYTHCLICTADLGRNETVEAFPVGRRLAFDAAKGRLWVVCRRCERWNLTPLEERWEAIEQCERRFRDARTRVSTENVGMARLKEGLELVRIGKPERPEFAAWRYGDQFGRRLRRNVLLMGAAGVAGYGLASGMAMLPLGSASASVVFTFLHSIYRRLTPIERLRDQHGAPLVVRHGSLSSLRVRPTSSADGWALDVEHEGGTTALEGEPARRALAQLLPHINDFAGSARGVKRAVARLEEAGGPDNFMRFRIARRRGGAAATPDGISPMYLPSADGLALEMAVHEESERRAMEGELAVLEERWKDAERIAAIADDLLVPRGVGETLARLERRVVGETGA